MSANMFIKFEEPEFPQFEILFLGRSPFSFTKYHDPLSKQLSDFCYGAKPIGKATVTCFRPDGATDKPVKYLEIRMQDVLISSCTVSGGGGDVPVATSTLEYGTIKYYYIDWKHAPD